MPRRPGYAGQTVSTTMGAGLGKNARAKKLAKQKERAAGTRNKTSYQHTNEKDKVNEEGKRRKNQHCPSFNNLDLKTIENRLVQDPNALEFLLEKYKFEIGPGRMSRGVWMDGSGSPLQMRNGEQQTRTRTMTPRMPDSVFSPQSGNGIPRERSSPGNRARMALLISPACLRKMSSNPRLNTLDQGGATSQTGSQTGSLHTRGRSHTEVSQNGGSPAQRLARQVFMGTPSLNNGNPWNSSLPMHMPIPGRSTRALPLSPQSKVCPPANSPVVTPCNTPLRPTLDQTSFGCKNSKNDDDRSVHSHGSREILRGNRMKGYYDGETRGDFTATSHQSHAKEVENEDEAVAADILAERKEVEAELRRAAAKTLAEERRQLEEELRNMSSDDCKLAHAQSHLSGPLGDLQIREVRKIYAPRICLDQNNWVSRECAWQCQLIVYNVEEANYEEMAVRSNYTIGLIKKAYLNQSKAPKETRFFMLDKNQLLYELDDDKELCEYHIRESEPVYASYRLRTGEKLRFV
ncbi:hypothetical protein AAMO2058_000123400 [Amorphochlora amoebiformis]